MNDDIRLLLGIAIAIFTLALAALYWPVKTKKPRELVCVTYAEGNKMLLANVGWRIAPEEDSNWLLNKVWLERDVNITDPARPTDA